MEKRTVHIVSGPTSDLACITAQLLYTQASSFYEITFEVDADNELCESCELERFGYFGYTLIGPTKVLEPAYDYVIDINGYMYLNQCRREAYQKNIYWEIECNEGATKALIEHVNFFVSRFNIVV